MRIDIKRGFDIPLDGAPSQLVSGDFATAQVALQPGDNPGLVPRLTVEVGDRVRAGDPVYCDRRDPAILFPSLVPGRVVDIRRGAKRRILEVVVEREGNDHVSFPVHDPSNAGRIAGSELRDLLLRSGLWTALRARPFDHVARPGIEPRALFVTAIDSRPHAPSPAVVLADQAEPFVVGVKALSRLASGKTYVCVAADSPVPVPDFEHIERLEFSGPHPAGLPGTHVHATELPVGRTADLWHIGYQDVAAIGRLLMNGELSPYRVISLAGPGARSPRLLRTTPGTSLRDLDDEWQGNPGCVISGSSIDGDAPARWLGRYHNQVTLLPPPAGAAETTFAALFRNVFSGRGTTMTQVDRSGMLPLEAFERVWPFLGTPQPLLRALLANDAEGAERLGCLGLAEEDLALCDYLCPGRNNYGAALRRVLHALETTG